MLGYSFDGLFAFEMARRLTAAGEDIAALLLLDAPVASRFLSEAVSAAGGNGWIFLRPLDRGSADTADLADAARCVG
ncbi:thioesterase domain-containing protein [Rhodoblastus acidophilus]|uniref:thioesterase domain-containing protein n=1 Tax=Rhodoblastus acidophilus TaxID=1074 RepID=UPI0023DDDFE9|nr:thioesterase domain-containing protein [Rhodoblastus acidophilus]